MFANFFWLSWIFHNWFWLKLLLKYLILIKLLLAELLMLQSLSQNCCLLLGQNYFPQNCFCCNFWAFWPFGLILFGLLLLAFCFLAESLVWATTCVQLNYHWQTAIGKSPNSAKQIGPIRPIWQIITKPIRWANLFP